MSYNVVKAAPTLTNVAYQAKALLGSVMTLTAPAPNTRTGCIKSITLTDLDINSGVIDVIFFDANPAGTFTSDVSVDPDDADITKVIGCVHIVAADYSLFADSAAACKHTIEIPFKLAGGDDLYCALMLVSGTPTYAVGALGIAVGFEIDEFQQGR